jgi:hypothetical protein
MPDRVSNDRHVGVRASSRSFLLLILCATVCGATACGRRVSVTLPTGTGTPFPEFTQAYAEATAECSGVKTLSASIKLSGRAGRTKLSARIDAGFAAPGQIRLEGYPPISFGGKPFFILVSNGVDTTLLMSRDGRVLRAAPPEAIVEALAGVALGPAELRTIVAGCGLVSGTPSSGRTFGNGWAVVDVDPGGTKVYLRQMEGRWRVGGATRGALSVTYADFSNGRPATVQVRTLAPGGSAAADLVLRLSQVEINPPLDSQVFELEVPRDAVPLTLEELRRAGPLGGESTEAAEVTNAIGATVPVNATSTTVAANATWFTVAANAPSPAQFAHSRPRSAYSRSQPA